MAPTPKAPTAAVQAKKPAHVPRARVARPKAKPALAKAEPAAPSPASAAPPLAFFLIGENKKLAGDVAVHEWGWKATKTGWDGPTAGIRFLEDFAAVQKAAAKGRIAVYEGYRWYATIAPHMLQALVDEGTVVKIPVQPL